MAATGASLLSFSDDYAKKRFTFDPTTTAAAGIIPYRR